MLRLVLLIAGLGSQILLARINVEVGLTGEMLRHNDHYVPIQAVHVAGHMTVEHWLYHWSAGLYVEQGAWETDTMPGVRSIQETQFGLELISQKFFQHHSFFGKLAFNIYSLGRREIDGYTSRQDVSSPYDVINWQEFEYTGQSYFARHNIKMSLGSKIAIHSRVALTAEGVFQFGNVETFAGKVRGEHANGSYVVSGKDTLKKFESFHSLGLMAGVAFAL